MSPIKETMDSAKETYILPPLRVLRKGGLEGVAAVEQVD